MRRTPKYKLPFNESGDFYRASEDAERMDVIDKQLADLSAIGGDGVLDGWNVSVSSGLILDVSPGSGFINGVYHKTLATQQITVSDNADALISMKSLMFDGVTGFPLERGGPPSAEVSLAFVDSSTPASITGFAGAANAYNAIDLWWTASTEVNFGHYAIERSLNNITWTPITTVAVAGTQDSPFTDTGLLEDTDYYYRIKSVNLSGTSSAYATSGIVHTLEDHRLPNDIRNLVLYPGEQRIALAFDPSITKDVISHIIYWYSVAPDGTETLINQYELLIPNDTYVITGLANGTQYKVLIKPKRDNGTLGLGTSDNATALSLRAPEDASSLVSTSGLRSVVLNWTASPTTEGTGLGQKSAYYVRVLYGSKISAPVKDIGLATTKTISSFFAAGVLSISQGAKIQIQEGSRYGFLLTTVDSFGNESGGVLVHGQPLDTTPPPVPTNLILTPDDTTISAEWTHSSGQDATGYLLIVNDGSPTDLGYVNTHLLSGLTNNVPVNVKIKAYDSVGNISPYVVGIATPFRETVAPTIPTGVTGAAGDSYIKYSWLPSSDTHLDHYVIWLRRIRESIDSVQTASFTTLPIDDIPSNPPDERILDVGLNENYWALNLKNGSVYALYVKAVDEYGNTSEFSLPILISPSAGLNVASLPGEDILVQPTDVAAINSGSTVTVSWDYPSYNTAPTSFSVYRSSSQYSGFAQVGGTIVTNHSYADRPLASGTYYYFVVAVKDAVVPIKTSGSVSPVNSVPVASVSVVSSNVTITPTSRLVRGLEAMLSELTLTQLAAHKHAAIPTNGLAVIAKRNMVLIDLTTLPLVAIEAFAKMSATALAYYSSLLSRVSTTAAQTTYIIHPDEIGGNIPKISDFQILVDGAVPSAEFSISNDLNAVVFSSANSGVSFTLDGLGFNFYIPAELSVSYRAISAYGSTLLDNAQVDYTLQTIRFLSQLDANITTLTITVEPIVPLYSSGSGAKPIGLSTEAILDDFVRLSDTHYQSASGAFNTGDVVFPLVNGRRDIEVQTFSTTELTTAADLENVTPPKPDVYYKVGQSSDSKWYLVQYTSQHLKYTVDFLRKTIVFNNPLPAEGDIVALEIHGREEVQGLLPPSRIDGIDASAITTGRLLKAQLPAISHEGRSFELALPNFSQATQADNPGYTYSATSVGNATTAYSIAQFGDGNLIIGTSSGLLRTYITPGLLTSIGDTVSISANSKILSGATFKNDKIVEAATTASTNSGRVDGTLQFLLSTVAKDAVVTRKYLYYLIKQTTGLDYEKVIQTPENYPDLVLDKNTTTATSLPAAVSKLSSSIDPVLITGSVSTYIYQVLVGPPSFGEYLLFVRQDPSDTQYLSSSEAINPSLSILDDGNILITGGNYVNQYGMVEGRVDVVLYDVQEQLGYSMTPMGSSRVYHTCSRLPDGKVLVTGGYHVASKTFITAEQSQLMDPATDASEEVIASGRYGRPATVFHQSCELYDPLANTWTELSDMSINRHFHSATVLAQDEVGNARVLIAGGTRGYKDPSKPYEWQERIEISGITTYYYYDDILFWLYQKLDTSEIWTQTDGVWHLISATLSTASDITKQELLSTDHVAIDGESKREFFTSDSTGVDGTWDSSVLNIQASQARPVELDGPAKQILIASETETYAVTGNNIYFSQDAGKNFSLMKGLEATGVVHRILYGRDSSIYAATDLGVYFITQEIKTSMRWFQGQLIGAGTTETFELCEYFDKVLAATEIGLFTGQIVDSDLTWQTTPLLDKQDVRGIGVIGSDIYAMAGQEVYKSSDAGVSWTRQGLFSIIDTQAIFRIRNQEIWLGTGYGLYVSTDFGQSFSLYISDRNRNSARNAVQTLEVVGGDLIVSYEDLVVVIDPSSEQTYLTNFTGSLPTVKVNGIVLRNGFRYNTKNNTLIFEYKRFSNDLVQIASDYTAYKSIGGGWYDQNANAVINVYVDGKPRTDCTVAQWTGSISFTDTLQKYNTVQISVSGTSLLNEGQYFHSEVEDKFDMEKGLPIILGRRHVNSILQYGLAIEQNFQEHALDRNQYYCYSQGTTDRSFNHFLVNSKFNILGKTAFDEFNSTVSYLKQAAQEDPGVTAFVSFSSLAYEDTAYYIGTDSGIFVLNPNDSFTITARYKILSEKNAIYDLKMLDGILYAATAEGLVRLDKTDTGLLITKNLGYNLPSKINSVASINNVIVAATDEGIFYSVDTQNINDLYGNSSTLVVNVVATDALAAEPNGSRPADAATFQIKRSGTAAVTVNYLIGGTATNGTDYTLIPSPASVLIPEGQSSVYVTVVPSADLLSEEMETVTLSIAPGSDYVIGTYKTAEVKIFDDYRLAITNVEPPYSVWVSATLMSGSSEVAAKSCQNVAVKDGLGFAAIGRELYNTIDGKTWKLIYTFADEAVVISKMAFFGNQMYLGTNKGLWADGASARSDFPTFTLIIPTGITEEDARSLAINDIWTDTERLSIVGDFSKIYTLTGTVSGKTWTTKDATIPTVHKILIGTSGQTCLIYGNSILTE